MKNTFYKVLPFKTANSIEGDYRPNTVAFNIVSRESIQHAGYDCYLVSKAVIDFIEEREITNIEYQEIEPRFSSQHDIDFPERKGNLYNAKTRYRIRRRIRLDESENEIEYEDDFSQGIVINRNGDLYISEEILNYMTKNMRLKRISIDQEIEEFIEDEEQEEEEYKDIYAKNKSNEYRSALVAITVAVLIVAFIFFK